MTGSGSHRADLDRLTVFCQDLAQIVENFLPSPAKLSLGGAFPYPFARSSWGRISKGTIFKSTLCFIKQECMIETTKI